MLEIGRKELRELNSLLLDLENFYDSKSLEIETTTEEHIEYRQRRELAESYRAQFQKELQERENFFNNYEPKLLI